MKSKISKKDIAKTVENSMRLEGYEVKPKTDYIQYAKYSHRSISIYNTVLDRWEVKMNFQSMSDRDKFFDNLDEENKAFLGDKYER